MHDVVNTQPAILPQAALRVPEQLSVGVGQRHTAARKAAAAGRASGARDRSAAAVAGGRAAGASVGGASGASVHGIAASGAEASSFAGTLSAGIAAMALPPSLAPTLSVIPPLPLSPSSCRHGRLNCRSLDRSNWS